MVYDTKNKMVVATYEEIAELYHIILNCSPKCQNCNILHGGDICYFASECIPNSFEDFQEWVDKDNSL